MSSNMYTNNNSRRDNWWFLGELPSKMGRYIVLDTETTGFSALTNNVIEVAAIEINKGKLTGLQLHFYVKPRNFIDPRAEEKHKLGNNFYNEFFNDCYHSDRQNFENFLKFVGNSVIFAHNASFDYHFINNELKFWKLPLLPRHKFRCTMRIFKTIFSQIDVNFKKYCSLEKCCEYFRLRSTKYSFHTAIFDSFMTARLLCKMFEYVDVNKNAGVNQNNGNVGNNLNIQNYGNNQNNQNKQIYSNNINFREKEIVTGITNENNNFNNKENLNQNLNNNLNQNLNKFYPKDVDTININVDMNYDVENDDPNITNNNNEDVDFLQEYEGFIKNYMDDDKNRIIENNFDENNYDNNYIDIQNNNIPDEDMPEQLNTENLNEILQNINEINHYNENQNLNQNLIQNLNENLNNNHLNEINLKTTHTHQDNNTKTSKYKELMREYLNTCEFGYDVSLIQTNPSTTEKHIPLMNLENDEELGCVMMLEDADLEQIIRDNI